MVTALLVARSPEARATTPDITAAAEQLFEEARALMAAGKHAEACPKFAESHRLDPGVGTLLNLADCYEKQGRTASAWATYIEAETLAQRQDQRPRAAFAAERARQLAPSLPRLAIDVAETRSEGVAVEVKVRRDGETIARPAWTTLVPVDPGEHRVEASAPGFAPFTTTVRVTAGAQARVVVPALTPLPVASSWSTQKTVGIVAAGAGLVAAGVGLGFGALAQSKNDEARADYCGATTCTPQGADMIADAKGAATVSTVLVSVGAAVLVGGAVLFFTAPGERRRTTATLPTLLGGTF